MYSHTPILNKYILFLCCLVTIFLQKGFANDTLQTYAFEKDSSFQRALKNDDIKALEICIDQYSGDNKKAALLVYHNLFTFDGEQQSLDIFYQKYGKEFSKEIKERDYEVAKVGDKLMLHRPFSEWKLPRYDEYIRMAAPNEKAFVALQKMIATDITNKNWKNALHTMSVYASFFEIRNPNYTNLIHLLEAKWNSTIKINSVGAGINTEVGDEYSPVITANDELLYFCGVDRKGNLGGEDIFVSKKVNDTWGEAEIFKELSTKSTNDAPINISSDGTTMLFFKSGRLLYSQKTTTGWAQAVEFPKTINGVGWQLDGMLTSDGKGLIFSSTREGGYNIFNDIQKYHGDQLYPADIYISLLSEDRTWGDPINLGATINTRFCERSPYLHADMKTLYFSSDGHGGLGKLDVFKSTRLSDSCWNQWSEPINLGKEINTAESDMGYKINTLGDKAYFSYERKPQYNTSILLLLDISGSMRGNKFQILKETLISVCETAIQNNSEIGILTYAKDCHKPIIDSCAFSKNINQLMQFIDKIQLGGDTPTYEAYSYASGYMKRLASKLTTNKVIMLITDGNATGCSSLEIVMRRIKQRKSIFRTQTVLYDTTEKNVSYAELKRISALTNGKFYSATEYDDFGTAFEAANTEIFNFKMTGGKDIYWVNLPLNLRPEFVSTVTGKVVDKENHPASVEIKWDDLETGKNQGVTKSDPTNGSYFIVLPNGKLYGYYVNEEAYLPVSKFVDLRNVQSVVKSREDLDLYTLKKLVESGQAIKINNVFFDFNKSVLLGYSIPELKRLSHLIQSRNLKVELSGHTDSVGDDDFNQALSERRTNAVKDFLVKNNCTADNILTVGYGEKKPVATNKTIEGRANNRRVEIRILSILNEK